MKTPIIKKKNYNVGENVLIYICPKQILKTCLNTLYCSIDTFRIIRKISLNAYVIDLPPQLDIASFFNV